MGQRVTHPPAYGVGMNRYTHAKTGFGLVDTRNEIAARVRREMDRSENPPPPRPPMRLTPENERLADLFLYAREFKHRLAA